jgi:eukaryotic-like serine/threonine-protein kinase
MDTTLARVPIGQLLDGRYRVESLLAHGGMATVYLGTDTRLDRTVALKIMHAELANDEDFVRRFVAEARSIARLSHPNVVTVYDQGADGRTLYLAMEYVPGETLRDLLASRGQLRPREALDIMESVLAGLAAAHEAGIAHRDVKPENVLIGGPRTVKVADFGLARLLSGTSHTKSGMLIGTAAYLAPEQVSRGAADVRTDVYAAGVMLFELLTGRQPHTGETPLAVAYKHVNEAVPPPSSVVPGLPPSLDTLVAMATSRDPDLRPADAGQFLRAISGARSGLPLDGPAPVPRPGPAVDPSMAETAVPRPAAPEGWPQPVPAPPVPAPPAAPTVSPWPPAWPTAPAGRDAVDMIPGMTPPARQSFGAPPDDTGPIATERFLPEPYRPVPEPYHPASNRTLIVSSADAPYGPAAPAGYPAAREPRLQRLLFSRRLGYLALAVVAIAVAAIVGWWLLAGRYTTVPKVAGMPAAAAQADLRNAGLTPVTGKAEFNNQVAKGMVVSTDPSGGARLAKGGRVTLIVSAGPHMITVPQVTGQPLTSAQAALKHVGLVPGKVKLVPSATIGAGIVIATDPGAGTSWPQPKPVTLTVSAGPPVPNFVGQPKTVAEGWAAANGVALNEVVAHSSSQPAGTVLRQSVKPGSAFTKGQVITIDISPGPPMVAIPNVDGMRLEQAARILHKLGFQVQVNQAGPFGQVVFDYSPTGSATKGSTITLDIGLPHL